MQNLFDIIDQYDDEVAYQRLSLAVEKEGAPALTQRYASKKRTNELLTPNDFLTSSLGRAQPKGMTPFHYALYRGKERCAKYLFMKNPSVLQDTNAEGETPLHEVARLNPDFRLRFFADSEISPFLQAFAQQQRLLANFKGETPLFTVMRHDVISLREFDVWCQLGHDSLLVDASGWGPIHLAAETSNNDVLSFLLIKHKNLLWSSLKDGRKIQHIAAGVNNSNGLRLCYESGCSFQATDQQDNTPLHYAAEMGAWQSLLFLLSHGGMSNLQNRSGYTPLHLAIMHLERFGSHELEVFDELFKHGADPFIKTTDEKSLNAHELARQKLSDQAYAQFKAAADKYNGATILTPDMLRFFLNQHVDAETRSKLMISLTPLFSQADVARRDHYEIMIETLKLQAAQHLSLDKLGEFNATLTKLKRFSLPNALYEEVEQTKDLGDALQIETELALIERTTPKTPPIARHAL